MPHQLEAAKTGRSKCRACKTAIEKGSVRLGEAVPNPFGDGEATHWYHLICGARRRPEAFLGAISAFEGEVPEISSEQLAALKEQAEKAVKFYRLSRFVKVHAAPSGRARCQGCHELIEKGALRFVLERIEDGMVSGAGFVHVGCAHKYAGSVDGVFERVGALSELSEEETRAVETSLAEQAELEEFVVERKAPGGSETESEDE